MTRELRDKLTASRLIQAIFPSKKSFDDFETEKGRDSKSPNAFIDFAFESGLISSKTKTAFRKHLTTASRLRKEKPIPDGFSFENLLTVLLNKLTSRNAMLESVNKDAAKFKMKKVQPSLITRLKKERQAHTPLQRDVLRLFAIRIAKHKIEPALDYEQILSLFNIENQSNTVKKADEGARILFALRSRGDIILPQSIAWLKNEIQECIVDMRLSHLYGKKHLSIAHDKTSLVFDLPKKHGPVEDPRSYAQCVRDAVALCHSIFLRWTLSDQSSPNRLILMAIGAGSYWELGDTLRALADESLPGDPFCRLTDFARLCANMSDIKAIFRSATFRAPSGGQINFSVLSELWTFLYYDTPPVLMKKEMLPCTKDAYNEFRHALYLSPGKVELEKFKALSILRRSPNNTFLALEVVKVLIMKRMFHDALEILSVPLAFQPDHLVCRTGRMMIFFFLAVHSRDWSVAQVFFERGFDESELIENLCLVDEEYFVELGIGHVGFSLKVLQTIDDAPCEQKLEKVIKNLKYAEKHFLRGMNLSTVGHRSLFWLFHSRSLRMIIENRNSEEKISDSSIFQKVAMSLFLSIGWISESIPLEDQQEMLAQRLEMALDSYQNAVLNRTFVPNTFLSFASVLDALMPFVSDASERITMLLNKTIEEVERIEKDGVGVFSNLHFLMCIQSPKKFKESVDRLLKSDTGNIFQPRLFFLALLDEPLEEGVYFQDVEEDEGRGLNF